MVFVHLGRISWSAFIWAKAMNMLVAVMCCFQWVILVVFLVCFVSLKFVIHTSADEPF